MFPPLLKYYMFLLILFISNICFLHGKSLWRSHCDFFPESTFFDCDFTTSYQNIFPTPFVQVLILPVSSAVHVLFVYSEYAAPDTREQASFTGLFDNTWLVFNRPINRFSSKFKPPGWGQTAVTRIHFTACSKGQCEMWRFWNMVRYGADMYPYEPRPRRCSRVVCEHRAHTCRRSGVDSCGSLMYVK